MDGSVAPSAIPDWLPRRPIDVDGYYALAAHGHLKPGERVELLEGQIIRITPVGDRHIGCVMALTHLLIAVAGARARVSVQMPVRLDNLSEPEPDLALLRPRADGYRSGGPPRAEDVLLLVEVADSSLREDRDVKAAIYAKHGVPELWVVDLAGTRVLVHTNPCPDGYGNVREARAGDRVAPVLLPEAILAVADILG
jgi:Uma2 family endonuclease